MVTLSSSKKTELFQTETEANFGTLQTTKFFLLLGLQTNIQLNITRTVLTELKQWLLQSTPMEQKATFLQTDSQKLDMTLLVGTQKQTEKVIHMITKQQSQLLLHLEQSSFMLNGKHTSIQLHLLQQVLQALEQQQSK